jgi:hypothetical protein
MTIGKMANELVKGWRKGRDGCASAKAGAERPKIDPPSSKTLPLSHQKKTDIHVVLSVNVGLAEAPLCGLHNKRSLQCGPEMGRVFDDDNAK